MIKKLSNVWDYGIMGLWKLWVIIYTSFLFSFTDTDRTRSQCVANARSAARTTLPTPLPP